MNKTGLKFTEAFKQKFLDNRTKTDKREGKGMAQVDLVINIKE
jgi:hypothetical protein